MRKLSFALAIVVITLMFSSCSKEENAAKTYNYTLDEEFVNNELGWNEFEDSESFNAKIVTTENGLFSVVTKLKTFSDFKEASLESTKDYTVETSFTLIREEGTSKSFSGLTWDHIDEDNYMLFSINQLGGDSRFVISEINNGQNPDKNQLMKL